MTSGLIGPIILWLIVAIIVVVIVAYLLHWLYHRSTKEVAFVRTGLGGEAVIINGGALVLPIVHEVTPVNLNVVRIPVTRIKEQAVITKDRMRVDIQAEFFVRVIQESKAVALAASTLGRKTMASEELADLLLGKFVGAMRAVAAEMTLDEMHEKRADYVSAVNNRANEILSRNGLELETVAITDLDQTDLEYFNPANRFDAEGLTKLIETIENRRKLRNDIEQTSVVAIRARNLEAEKETLILEQESESSRLNQQRDLEAMRAEQRAEIIHTQSEKDADAEKSRIANEQKTRELEIARQQSVQTAEIKAQEEVEQVRIAQELALEAIRIDREKKLKEKQIKQRHEIDSAEIAANEDIERARIVSERLLQETRITADEETESRNVQREQQVETAKIAAHKAVESSRIVQEQTLDKARIERDRMLQAQRISLRQAIEESEISAHEELERARIASERGLDEARLLQERDLKRLEIERNQTIELAEIERQIAVLEKQSLEADARVETEAAEAKAVEAKENVSTIRETIIAERIAKIDRLIAAKNAETTKIAAEADKVTAGVNAEAQRALNEAENILSDEARAGRLRAKMLDRLEGIVRESVKPMENIEGIKILHVEGLNGGGGNGPRSPTDEVIESALRYRAQAPLIDEMMKEIGIENPGVSKMGDIFRSAKDAQSLANNASSDKKKGD